MMDNGSSVKVKKLDGTCVKAIEDLKKKIEDEYRKSYGCDRKVYFTEASKVLGIKYFQRNFGRIPIDEVKKVLREK